MNPFVKKRLRNLIIVATVLMLGFCAWLAADRYLIEHVVLSQVSAMTESMEPSIGTTVGTKSSTAAWTISQTTAEITSGTTVATGVSDAVDTSDTTIATVEETTHDGTSPTGTAAVSLVADPDAIWDDTHYQSGNLSVSIEQVVTGSGKNTVTYYVADVQIADASLLQSAFAKDSFGTNIIEYPSVIAEDNDAILAINGDYYGFRDDGIIIRNGVLYRDEGVRTGLAFYRDGTMQVYDETTTSGQALLDAGVWQTLSFGPAIVLEGEIPAGIENIEVDTNFGNHSIQGSQPRTGIGILSPNHYVFVVVDGRSSGYSKGVTMTEFAGIFQTLGCMEAYNIDGGGSSTMVFMDEVVNNPLGRNKERGTSDILYVAEPQS